MSNIAKDRLELAAKLDHAYWPQVIHRISPYLDAPEIALARDALRQTADILKELRRFVIVQTHQMAYGGGTVHTGWTCKSCNQNWGVKEPENHTPQCLATRYPITEMAKP